MATKTKSDNSKTMLHIKVDKKLKDQAQKIARDIGLSLSAVVGGYLQTFVLEKEITFVHEDSLNEKTRREMREIMEDVKAGKNLSPVFEDVADFKKWLQKEDSE